jgi:hypothetical protein
MLLHYFFQNINILSNNNSDFIAKFKRLVKTRQSHNVTREERCIPMKHTYFPKEFCNILHTYSLIGRLWWPRGLRHELSSLVESWNHGFESYSRHGLLCVRLFCVCVVLFVVAVLRRAFRSSKESHCLCKKDYQLKKRTGSSKRLQSH